MRRLVDLFLLAIQRLLLLGEPSEELVDGAVVLVGHLDVLMEDLVSKSRSVVRQWLLTLCCLCGCASWFANFEVVKGKTLELR